MSTTTTPLTPTPRTDAAAGFVQDANEEYPQCFLQCPDGTYVPVEVARQMERELATVTRRLERVMEHYECKMNIRERVSLIERELAEKGAEIVNLRAVVDAAHQALDRSQSNRSAQPLARWTEDSD